MESPFNYDVAIEHGALEALGSYVSALTRAGAPSDADARAQIFKPTAYPEKIVVSTGVVLSKPTRVEYAPDIEVAETKIRSLTHAARCGKLAVINISVEPGSGKTLHLPFKFAESNSLVVLPTVFDAWSARMSCGKLANICVYGYESNHASNVTYTDSYHAAYLLTTGAISKYNIVFVDESHSQDGVTSFMADACVPGVIFVRMTATPPAVNSRPKRSFPIMEERRVPALNDTNAVAEFVSSRREERILVMTPTPQTAEILSSAIPGSKLLTASSPLDVMGGVLADQTDPSIIITDSACSKGVNLNLDAVIDFGMIGTPTGNRPITKTEQLQRRCRVGRNKGGVYCCPMVATDSSFVDEYSVFRNNLWYTINGLFPVPCKFPPVSVSRAKELVTVFCEPAVLPVSPVMEQQSDSSSQDAFGDCDSVAGVSDALHEFSIHADSDDEVDIDAPPWFFYYVVRDNHPVKYVGDLVHDHRKLSAGSAYVAGDVIAAPVGNRLAVDYKVAAGSSSSGESSHHRVPSDGSGRVVELRSYSSASPTAPVVIKSTRSHKSTRERALVDGIATKRYMRAKAKGHAPGAPIHLTRSTKTHGVNRGTVYKALSVSGEYAVETGLVLASSPKVHRDLSPLDKNARHALSTQFADETLHRATHYLSWTVAQPIAELDVALWSSEAKRVGAWAVPPLNQVPAIDLQVDYHPAWISVVTDRVRNRLVLPPVVPRVGWPKRAARDKLSATSPLDCALDACDNPSYTVPEQQMVYRAWNVLAMRSAVVGGGSLDDIFADASILLAYMVSADRLSEYN